MDAKMMLLGLLGDIKVHRQRTGEYATVRGFYGWSPVWLPASFGCVIANVARA